MRYDPYLIKKIERVWFATHEPPLVQFFNGRYGIPGAIPKVIDLHTHEFTPEEQVLQVVNTIMDLDRFQFLVQIATGEGGKKEPVKKITIEHLDKNQYANENILAPLRQALTKRDSIPLATMLAEMEATRLAIIPEKKQKSPRQLPIEPATMKNDHDPQPIPPTQSISQSGTGSAKTTPTGGKASARPNRAFWEPKANETADDSPNTA